MALDAKAVQFIIFDMDDTLFDTYGQLVQPASHESCRAMIEAGLDADLEDCLKARHELGLAKPRANIYKELVRRFGLRPDVRHTTGVSTTAVNVGEAFEGSEESERNEQNAKKPEERVAEAGANAFFNREIKESIKPFDDALATLKHLGQSHKLYLVTLGAVKTQKRKVELLDFAPYFSRIFYSDVNSDKNKRRAFKEILDLHHGAKPHEFLAVGNRIDSEIREAKELGMQTVLMEHGEYVHLVPHDSFEEPDARISKLAQLKDLLK